MEFASDSSTIVENFIIFFPFPELNLRMLRFIFLLTAFFLISPVIAQKIDVRLDKAVFDFGYIKESEGKVFAEVEFKNYSSFPVTVFKIISSCGCTVAEAESGWIAPGAKGKIKFSYDPEGRPGKFVKSFEIQFVSDSLKAITYLNIKGYTIERELLQTYFDNHTEGLQLMIKPFATDLINLSDHRFLTETSWQHFMNDITYEIDQNGFANIKLQLASEKKQDCSDIKELFTVIHNHIISELEKRKYQSWAVGFTDDSCQVVHKEGNLFDGIKLKISSRDFNSDTIPESGFFLTGNKINQNIEMVAGIRDSVEFKKSIIKEFSFSSVKFLAPDKSNDYSSLLNILNRKILTDKMAFSGLVATIGCRPEDRIVIEKKLMSEFTKIQEKIIKDAEETGADRTKITFAVPEINFISDSLQKKGKYRIYPWKLRLFYPNTDFQSKNKFNEFVNNDSLNSKKLNDFLMQSGFIAPIQNLPVFETIHYGKYEGNEEKEVFEKWMEIIYEEIQAGKKIDFILESSVGRELSLKESELEYEARNNAAKLKNKVFAYFKEKQVSDTMYSFQIASVLVQGPACTEKKSEQLFTNLFNYLKLVPAYSDLHSEITKIPYQINFENNSYDLPANTAVFQNFISRLVDELNSNGYVLVMIESSSSKIPSTIYENNHLLSYFRAEEAEKKIRSEISKRGYDAKKVIITEKRNLVQGPDYKTILHDKIIDTKPFQYIKIIPSELIKN